MEISRSSENTWLDVSAPVHSGMQHWPGEPEVLIDRIADMGKGNVANVSVLSMSAHTGTHMDAPRHFFKEGKDISLVPFEVLIGPALLIEVKNPQRVDLSDLMDYDLRPESRVLLKTANSEKEWFNMDFSKSYTGLSASAAKYLAERKVRLVGIDFLSIGTYEEDEEVHRVLLGSGIWIIEGLYLKGIPEGIYDMICLPLRLIGSDGAPARAVLRKI
ncbi:MAG: cyclase family protein [Ignavibacteria bacterium]|nr:cyclase family protein [Ignavibacteria bacterium]MCU7502112.1 cyclase family protein [Ignavibacteria bacterium]MCU7515514.1 cyclase family protein [Ignavibacteria bacterium]